MKRLIAGFLAFFTVTSAFSCVAYGEGAENTEKIRAYVDGSETVHTSNMKVYTGDNGKNAISSMGGKKGWLFDVESDSTDYYLYIDVDDNLADKKDMGRVVEISVDYFDKSNINIARLKQVSSAFCVEYQNTDGKIVESPYFELDNSLMWHTYTFTLTDAVLQNGVNGADFRICLKSKTMGTSGGSFVVNNVEVNLTDKFNHINIVPSTESYGNNFFTGEKISFKYTLDNKKYAEKSRQYGAYPLNVKFSAKNIEGDVVFEKTDTLNIEPCKETEYNLDVDVGGKYGVYFLTAVFYNDEHKIYSEKTTRFSYVRTDYGKTMNYAFGTCSGRRDEWAPLYQKAGIGIVRAMESYSNVISRDINADEAFVYPRRADTLSRALKERNIKQINTYLSVKTDLLPGEQLPYTEKGMKKYTDYIDFVTESERFSIVAYDMWNEFELMGASFNLYSRPMEDYINLMKTTYTRIKEKAPDLKLYGVVTSTVRSDILEDILKAGGGDYMDGYCCHAYAPRYDPMSGGLIKELEKARAVLDKYGYYDMPIVTSELGWADDTYYGIDEKRQGYYLVEGYAAMRKVRNFNQYVMYTFYDGGRTKGNREHHWGLIEFLGADTPGTAKASYAMVANMNNLLAGYEYKDEITVNDNTYAYRMHSNDKNDDTIMLWSRGNGGNLSIDLGTDKIDVYDAYGNVSALSGIDGVFGFALTEAPIYLKGDFKKFELAENKIIDKNAFDVEFSQSVSFNLKNANGGMRYEITPVNGAKLDISEVKGENSSDIHIKPNKYGSETDRAKIKVFDGNGTYLDGYLSFFYKTPIDVDMKCEPGFANGVPDYEVVNLSIDIANNSKETVNGKFVINRLTGIEDYNSEYDSLSINPGDTYKIIIKAPSDVNVVKMEAAFVTSDGITVDFAKSASFAVCEYAYNKPVTDGKIGENEYKSFVYLGADNAVDIHAVDPYTGADDCSALLYYSWDEENFYIAANVTDNVLFDASPQSAAMWRYDSFQLAGVYDPENMLGTSVLTSVLYGKTNGENTLEMVKSSAFKAMTDADSGFEGAISRDGKITCYELKIPWKTVLTQDVAVQKDTIFKFSALINDNDGGGRKAAVQYGEGIYTGGTTNENFIKAYLAKTPNGGNEN